TDGSVWTDIGNVLEYTPSADLSLGVLTLYIRAIDSAGNNGTAAQVEIVIEQTDPTVGAVSPTTATTGTSTQLTVEASDLSGISSCTLFINSASAGNMVLDSVSGDYGVSHTFTSAGTYSAYASCTDAAGNDVAGSTVSVTVSGGTSSADTTSPTVGSVRPTSVTIFVETEMYATVSDAGGIDYCDLYVDDFNSGEMTVADDRATFGYTFDTVGAYEVHVKCYDLSGNSTTGSETTITVSLASSEEDDAVSEAEEGNLVKMACLGGEDVNDPCRAVYYFGEDGKRHAFPNEKVFFTWYDSFDDIVIVTDDYMASITLGRNVTYHPGTTMVKFPSLNTVYAVGTEGELRAVASEEVAASIWGSDWNEQIDDISEAFFGNYSFGDDINNTSDFDQDNVEDSVTSIDEIL
ncbi:MAG: hypothetical protein NUV56_04755, partial [Candidatus Uhrbacteria bacterium]|nr:hypothetical protein [Candidatus Uhrbacteria bacterium]